jgi:hypothetical protein
MLSSGRRQSQLSPSVQPPNSYTRPKDENEGPLLPLTGSAHRIILSKEEYGDAKREIVQCLPAHARHQYLRVRNQKAEKALEEYQENLRKVRSRYVNAAGIRSGQQTVQEWDCGTEYLTKLAHAWFDAALETCELYDIPLDDDLSKNISENIRQYVEIQFGHLARKQGQDQPNARSQLEGMGQRVKWAIVNNIELELERARVASQRKNRDKEDGPVPNAPKKRFSVGRRVLVGMGMRPAVVVSFDDNPSVLGEYAHLVEFDDTHEKRRTLGCDMHAVPELDQDLHGRGPAIHIHNSNVGNINLGNQIGDINVAVQQFSKGDAIEREFAHALDEFTKAVVDSTLPDSEKREVVDSLSTIAEQATKKPEERSRGTLKALLEWMPKAIATAYYLTELWGKYEPAIRAHFGF